MIGPDRQGGALIITLVRDGDGYRAYDAGLLRASGGGPTPEAALAAYLASARREQQALDRERAQGRPGRPLALALLDGLLGPAPPQPPQPAQPARPAAPAAPARARGRR